MKTVAVPCKSPIEPEGAMASDYRNRSIVYRSISLMRMAAPQASRMSMLAAHAAAVALMASGLGARPASATVICDSPGLPPGCGEYRTPANVHAVFANPDPDVIEAILTDISHQHFLNIVITPLGPDEFEEFDSTLAGLIGLTLTDGTVIPDIPFNLTGPVQVLTLNKTGNTTGTFDTEIVSISLTGNILGLPVEIRESPELPSLGQTTITDIGGGLWAIDSFFDIFVEISIEGGPFVIQADGPTRVTLVPEPSTFSLGVLAMLGFALYGQRRKRSPGGRTAENGS